MTAKAALEPVHVGELDHTLIGRVVVAAGEAGAVAVSIGMAEPERFAHFLQEKRLAQIFPGNYFVESILGELSAYFDGKQRGFDIPIDFRAMTNFQRAVYEIAQKVPFGSFGTYSGIAAQLGIPKGARAVGQALARNPIPIIIPCHRIISKVGSLQGYSAAGGIKTKRLLLTLEGVMLL